MLISPSKGQVHYEVTVTGTFPPVFQPPGIFPPVFPHRFFPHRFFLPWSSLPRSFPLLVFSPPGLFRPGPYPPRLLYPKLLPLSLGSQNQNRQLSRKYIYLPYRADAAISTLTDFSALTSSVRTTSNYVMSYQ